MLEEMRNIRKRRGLTMKQLGEKVGLAEVTISTYETGRSEPSLGVLCAIADVLDVSLDVLVRGKEKTLSKERAMQEAISRLDGLDSSALREVVAFAQYLVYRKEREQAEGQASADN